MYLIHHIPMSRALAASIAGKMSAVFQSAVVRDDGLDGVTLHHPSGVHVVVDFICLDNENKGSVAVHARPDHVFRPHWEEGETRVLTINGERFDDGDGTDGHEFEDGLGNTVWMFTLPGEEERIAILAVGLAKLAAARFV